jgi:hypothetical protein
VSIELAEPEINDLSYDDGEISLTVRLVKTCMECGEELAEAYPEATATIDHLEDHLDSIEVDEINIEQVDRMEGHGRYAKMFYGADVTVEWKCHKCGKGDTVEMHVEEQASYFDELY